MFIKLLMRAGINEVSLAGFDGYTEDNSVNYYSDYIRLLYCQDNVMLRNEAIREELKELSNFVQIHSITPTRYL